MARELAAQKFNLVLVARNEDAFEKLSHEVASKYGVQTRIVALDLVQDGAPLTLHAQVNDIDIGLLIASAGIDEMGHLFDILSRRNCSTACSAVQLKAANPALEWSLPQHGPTNPAYSIRESSFNSRRWLWEFVFCPIDLHCSRPAYFGPLKVCFNSA